jgi:hypothetical protein
MKATGVFLCQSTNEMEAPQQKQNKKEGKKQSSAKRWWWEPWAKKESSDESMTILAKQLVYGYLYRASTRSNNKKSDEEDRKRSTLRFLPFLFFFAKVARSGAPKGNTNKHEHTHTHKPLHSRGQQYRLFVHSHAA